MLMLVVNLDGGRRIYKQFGMADEIFHLLKREAPSEREASRRWWCVFIRRNRPKSWAISVVKGGENSRRHLRVKPSIN